MLCILKRRGYQQASLVVQKENYDVKSYKKVGFEIVDGNEEEQMGKKLSQMNLEELWQLFPIFLTEHEECWKDWYHEEETALKGILPSDRIKRISHIGSTAIKAIWAKPIIDILVEVSEGYNLQEFKEPLSEAGYIGMAESEKRISFNKGYTENGFEERVYHLHLRMEGNHDELYFRDYLNEYPAIAAEYEALKLRLWKQYEHNRDAYTESKAAFVKEQTRRAKLEFGNRYEV